MLNPGVHRRWQGEQHCLTVPERKQLYQLARAAAPRPFPIYTGVAAFRTKDAVELAQAAQAAGATGIMLGFPPYRCRSCSSLSAVTHARFHRQRQSHPSLAVRTVGARPLTVLLHVQENRADRRDYVRTCRRRRSGGGGRRPASSPDIPLQQPSTEWIRPEPGPSPASLPPELGPNLAHSALQPTASRHRRHSPGWRWSVKESSASRPRFPIAWLQSSSCWRRRAVPRN